MPTLRPATGVCLLIALQCVFFVSPASAGTFKCFGKRPTIVQREGQILIRGTSGADVILIREGRGNHVKSRGGNDRVCDRGSTSVIQGGAGRDRISAGQNDDTAHGGDGDDIMKGGNGARDGDELVGGKGDDDIDGGKGLDFLYGEEGKDELISAVYAEGGPGDDTIEAKSRTILVYENAPQGVVVDLGEGTASGEGQDTFDPGTGHGVVGSDFADVLEGNNRSNLFIGADGADVIRGFREFDNMFERARPRPAVGWGRRRSSQRRSRQR